MHKLILKNFQALGDIVMLTAAVRDLHTIRPNTYRTDVRTSCFELWDNNPYISPVADSDPGARVIDCEYPLIHSSNTTSNHFINGFTDFLAQALNEPLRSTAFQGDIHLSSAEKSWMSQVHEITGLDMPFWLVLAGGKFDFTIKWWETQRYQEVVDHYHGKVLFVQVGEASHYHPGLCNVIDLRGKTDIRQLVRLMYHAQGVLCPVTGAMHLAAAVEVKPVCDGQPMLLPRPCVVVAGGREPPQWEAYPHHRFLHTIGALPCCARGGCWKSRSIPIGDGDHKDWPGSLCQDLKDTLPHCMSLIEPGHVISAIDSYFSGGQLARLSPVAVMRLKELGIWPENLDSAPHRHSPSWPILDS